MRDRLLLLLLIGYVLNERYQPRGYDLSSIAKELEKSRMDALRITFSYDGAKEFQKASNDRIPASAPFSNIYLTYKNGLNRQSHHQSTAHRFKRSGRPYLRKCRHSKCYQRQK